MEQGIADSCQASAPFEGPEKLLEIWFTPCATDVPGHGLDRHGRTGLRKVKRETWEEMLDIVKCKVLSIVEGTEMDAYLLSESSLFISPHRLILKTCGTTLNLLGLPRILEIAATEADLPFVYRCFYSRKSFMFPDRQLGPHRDWKQEVEYLDNIFQNGAAYTVGKVNGDHWLLYMTSPGGPNAIPKLIESADDGVLPDYTIEILMSDLALSAREPFFLSLPPSDGPSSHAQTLSKALGISSIFPTDLTILDAHSFSPCGYSANALIRWGEAYLSNSSPSECHQSAVKNVVPTPKQSGEGYYTIHVTPEEGWSYASFECNVPLSTSEPASRNTGIIPDIKSLVQRVVAIFKPGRLSLTLFISSEVNEAEEEGESAVEAAQRAFKLALTCPAFDREAVGSDSDSSQDDSSRGVPVYKRTDKINYEFGGYDLAFASFEMKRNLRV